MCHKCSGLPAWFLVLKWSSYALNVGAGMVVFFGGCYTLFFAPVSSIDPSSLSPSSPTWQKALFLLFILALILWACVANRYFWGRWSTSLIRLKLVEQLAAGKSAGPSVQEEAGKSPAEKQSP